MVMKKRCNTSLEKLECVSISYHLDSCEREIKLLYISSCVAFDSSPVTMS